MNIVKSLKKASLFTACLSSFSFAETHVDWSANMATIKETSKDKFIEEKQRSLTFETQLFDLDFNLEYIFDEGGKLNHILYYRSFSPQSVNCIEEYHFIKTEVIKEIGSAKTTKNIYNDKIDASSTEVCGYVATGEYGLNTEWKGKPENTSLVLSTWKGRPYIGLSYNQSSH